ncbi:hypothetical protein RJ640_026222 [Escallonia rubra]|uniref:AB hydrolase-1 domain-containing protein n=1 Tax=Escallonia rubra TaxID=112253 RepID=A0AA88RG30_9ASTE|nr:hypothetical protein RJ640_026222 [Escallonia rubra]
MSNCVVYHQTVFLGRPEPPNFPAVSRRWPILSLQSRDKLFGLSSKEAAALQFLPKAASASVSGSGAEYSEQLLGEKLKKKSQRIAGVDQDELVEPAILADPDSCFCEFKGVQIHHKVCDEESAAHNTLQDGTSSQFSYQTKKLGLPMILLHGFGASVYSWSRVMKQLAQVTGSKVLAFDRPAFGLTSRVDYPKNSSPGVEHINPYSMIFSVLATLYFIDFLAAKKTILVGHSAGALVAADTYFAAPERVAALVLVAPAIIAPRSSQKAVKEKESGRNGVSQDDRSDANIRENPMTRLSRMFSKLSRNVMQAILNLVKGMGDMFSSIYKKALSAFLRSALGVMLVRMVIDKFGIAAIRNSWYDSNQITDHVLHGYTKPLRVKSWDRALVEFTAATLTDSVPQSKPLSKRLHEISCPVLIITGDSDRLVPSWNAERLSRAIPGSCLEVVKNCGHLPQEEKSEEFVSIVENFLQRSFGGSEVQLLQAAS